MQFTENSDEFIVVFLWVLSWRYRKQSRYYFDKLAICFRSKKITTQYNTSDEITTNTINDFSYSNSRRRKTCK